MHAGGGDVPEDVLVDLQRGAVDILLRGDLHHLLVLLLRLRLLLRGLIHGRGHHADEKSQHHERADHDEDEEVKRRQEVEPPRVGRVAGGRHAVGEVAVLVAAEHVDVHDVRPVLAGGHAEEREQRVVQRAEVPRVVLLEEDHADLRDAEPPTSSREVRGETSRE